MRRLSPISCCAHPSDIAVANVPEGTLTVRSGPEVLSTPEACGQSVDISSIDKSPTPHFGPARIRGTRGWETAGRESAAPASMNGSPRAASSFFAFDWIIFWLASAEDSQVWREMGHFQQIDFQCIVESFSLSWEK
ncbi:hypothetical protein AVEN_43359-1 [Araneus ventricosus]|uniref:Uncharacterized protein n=1 Tax=Araneus ventricosus TaxID=182803 RepID=A0A4Y2VA46_ARAVE|nr:hypothetical protein AVEN_43359-1 [Araneus ventricosus]